MAPINVRNHGSATEDQITGLPNLLEVPMDVQIAPPKDETCDDVIAEIMSLIELYSPKDVRRGSFPLNEHGDRPMTPFSLSSLSSADGGSVISSDLSIISAACNYHGSILFRNSTSPSRRIIPKSDPNPVLKRYSAPTLSSAALEKHAVRPTTPGTKILEWRRSVSNRCSQIISSHYNHHEVDGNEWHPTSRWSMSTVAPSGFFGSRKSFGSRASDFIKESKEKLRQSPIKKLFKRSASMSSNIT